MFCWMKDFQRWSSRVWVWSWRFTRERVRRSGRGRKLRTCWMSSFGRARKVRGLLCAIVGEIRRRGAGQMVY